MRLAQALGTLLFVACAPALAGFTTCGGSAGPPPARGCDDPADVSVITGLDVGDADGSFTPSARLSSMRGAQGSPMTGYRIAVRATEPIDCIALEGSNLHVTASGSWYATDPLWSIDDRPSRNVHVFAYGMVVDRVMRVDGAPPGDAGSDAPPIDATAPSDASADDGGDGDAADDDASTEDATIDDAGTGDAP